ncbi:hypothetical protein GX420_02585, partial [bacterium]|nr:hypothetical protein [bacterium]
MNKNINNIINNIINDNNIVVIEKDYISKTKYFQEINAEAVLHKKKIRIVQNANLEKKQYTIYHIGQYKYFDSEKNRYRYITDKIEGVTGKRHYDDETIIRAVKPVLENKMTISDASNYAKENYHLRSVPSTIWNWAGIIEITKESKKEIENETKSRFSGHIGIDEVYDNEDGIIFITDLVNNTIISSKICEGKPDNKIIEEELKNIINNGFTPVSCTKDGSPLYINTITKVFIDISIQTCIFHLIKNLIKYFMDWHRRIRSELKIKSLPRGLKCSGNKLKQFLFKKRTLFVKRNLKEKEEIEINKIMEALPEFKRLRNKYLKFLSIFDSQNIDEAEKKYWLFISDPIVNEKLPNLVKQLKKHFDNKELFSYMLFDKSIWTKIRTTNQTERTNRKFRKKQKTHYRIRSKIRREKLIDFMYYFHNHT